MSDCPISATPLTSTHAVTGGRYDLNVGRLIEDYPNWYIKGASSGFGWSAQRRVMALPRGPEVTASSLDELAGKMDAADAAPYPAEPGDPKE